MTMQQKKRPSSPCNKSDSPPKKFRRTRGRGSICELIPLQTSNRLEHSSTNGTSSKRDDDTDADVPIPTVEQRVMESRLKNRRYHSLDLVEHVFGATVSRTLATEILLGFIRLGIVGLTIDGQAPTPEQVIDACAEAYDILDSVLTEKKHHTKIKSYDWSFAPNLADEGAEGTARFLNAIAVIAYHVASSVKGDTSFKNHDITTLWRRAFHSDRQFIVAIPSKAFTKDKPPTADGKDQYTSLYEHITNHVLTKSRLPGPLPSPKPYVSSNTTQMHDFLQSSVAGIDFDNEALSKYDYTYVNREYIDFAKVSCTGEVTTSVHPRAVTQELIYMEQQRTAQPQRRFVLGLAVSDGKMTLCRADPIGTEECTIPLDCGSGILEAIRVILGFATANQEDFGQSPQFETSKDGNSLYFNTPSEPTQRYYLHHFVNDDLSLVGRMTRVWCAYRQVETEDEITRFMHEDDQRNLVRNGKDVFVGPYALKLQYGDHASMRISEEIKKVVEEERRMDNKTGVLNILVPEETFEGESVMDGIRGFYEDDGVPEAMKSLARHQEIITVSLFKRTLAEYESFAEVARAVADGYRAIEWLKSKGFLHRDISDGNLLLSREERTLFKEPYSPNSTDLLCRRKVSSPEGVYGLLHDFDMAGLINTPPAQPDSNRPFRNGRTGTPPFMSINVLKNDFNTLTNTFHTHEVADDAESLFYVLYLFPFSNGGPQASVYPNERPFIDKDAVWPEPIMEWASWQGRNVSGIKAKFFGSNSYWRLNNPLPVFGEWIKKHWPVKDGTMKEVTAERKEAEKRRRMWYELVTMLHDKFLWWNPYSTEPDVNPEWLVKRPLKIEELLPQLIKALDDVFSNNREDYTL